MRCSPSRASAPPNSAKARPLRTLSAMSSSTTTIVTFTPSRCAIVATADCRGAVSIDAASCSAPTTKSPIAVRRRRRRWATPPNASPRSAASVRMYVPDEHVTSIFTTGLPSMRSTMSPTTYRYTVTGRGARSTSPPSRAISCKRRPPICIADTIGGI